ncbi:MAG: ribosome maturation factor RimP [Bdellovibrionales bacterium]|nr:ribosome maturation factor RimP [Bdellovibrionales bacterium]
MRPDQLEKIKEHVTTICASEGCRLYDVEFVSGSRGQGRVLRVYIDRPDNGVSIDDCANVSRALSLILDVEDLIEGDEYALEVSSPGLDRTLKQLWHFEAAVGSRIELKTRSSMEVFNPTIAIAKNRHRATGQLVRIDGGDIFLNVDGFEFRIPFQDIEKAKRIFVPEKGDMKGRAEKSRD